MAQARASVLDSCGQYCSGDKSSLGESLSHLKRLRKALRGSQDVVLAVPEGENGLYSIMTSQLDSLSSHLKI